MLVVHHFTKVADKTLLKTLFNQTINYYTNYTYWNLGWATEKTLDAFILVIDALKSSILIGLSEFKLAELIELL